MTTSSSSPWPHSSHKVLAYDRKRSMRENGHGGAPIPLGPNQCIADKSGYITFLKD